jgi:hypothetical protein
MNIYTYYVEGVGIEVVVTASNRKEAHKMAWQLLTDEQQNACCGLDWVDTQPA